MRLVMNKFIDCKQTNELMMISKDLKVKIFQSTTFTNYKTQWLINRLHIPTIFDRNTGQFRNIHQQFNHIHYLTKFLRLEKYLIMIPHILHSLGFVLPLFCPALVYVREDVQKILQPDVYSCVIFRVELNIARFEGVIMNFWAIVIINDINCNENQNKNIANCRVVPYFLWNEHGV